MHEIVIICTLIQFLEKHKTVVSGDGKNVLKKMSDKKFQIY